MTDFYDRIEALGEPDPAEESLVVRDKETAFNEDEANAESQLSDNCNTTLDQSMQLKVTNDRLAKLERMYDELSRLEQKAKSK